MRQVLLSSLVVAAFLPLAATASSLYVSSYGTDSVLGYEGTTGAFIEAFVASGSGGLKGPVGLTFGPDGNLYVGSLGLGGIGSQGILRYDSASGKFLNVFVPAGSGGLIAPLGMTFGPDKNLYVVDFVGNQVLRFDGNTGAFQGVFASSTGTAPLNEPAGIVFGPDNNLYLSTGANNVLRYDGMTGAFLGSFVSAGSGGLNSPDDLKFGPDGNLYVGSELTSEVLRYDGKTGAFLGAFVSSGSGGLTGAGGLTFGPDGNLYVGSASGGLNNILRYNGQTGAFLNVFVTSSSGGLDTPTLFTFGPNIVPEPSTILLVTTAFVVLFWARVVHGRGCPSVGRRSRSSS